MLGPGAECRGVGDLLIYFQKRELDPERSEIVESHLAECAECRGELQELVRAAELARGLRVESADVDRYPEFLRRLAGRPARPDDVAVSTSDVPCETEGGAPALPANHGRSGAAILLPLFGRTLAIRSGFGRGFEMVVVGKTGAEILKVSVTSLARAAAIGSIVTLVPTFVVMFLVLPWARRDGKPTQQEVQYAEGPIGSSGFGSSGNGAPPPPMHSLDISAAPAGDLSVIVTQGGGGLIAKIWNRGRWGAAMALPSLAPPSRNLVLQGSVMGTLASDGENAVFVGSSPQGMASWRIAPVEGKVQAATLLRDQGDAPDLCWNGDRYLLAWTSFGQRGSSIWMMSLDRLGQPASDATEMSTGSGVETGPRLPSIAGNNACALLCYQTLGGGIRAHLFRGDPLREKAPSKLLVIPASFDGLMRKPRIRELADGFLVFWAETSQDGTWIFMVRVDNSGAIGSRTRLVYVGGPIPAWDVSAGDQGPIVAWIEASSAGVRVMRQEFDGEGERVGDPTVVPSPGCLPSGLAIGNPGADVVFWLCHTARGGPRMEVWAAKPGELRRSGP